MYANLIKAPQGRGRRTRRGRQVAGSCRLSLGIAVETFGGDGHQLRDSGEVPVGIDHPGVPDVDREDRQAPFDVATLLVETQCAAYDEGMAEIVQPVMGMVPAHLPAQLATHPVQRVQHASLINGPAIVT